MRRCRVPRAFSQRPEPPLLGVAATAGIRKKLPVAGSKEITKVEKDLIIWLDACGIASTTIWGICNMLKTDEEMKELISFSLDIPEEMYRNNPSEAEEQILAKALQITQNRKIE